MIDGQTRAEDATASEAPPGAVAAAEPLTGVRVYDALPYLRRPRALIVSMLRDLVDARGLAWQLAVRDVRAQYRQTALGYFWAFVPPLLTAGAFIGLHRTGVFQVADPGMGYEVYALTGTMIWQTFADSVQAPLATVVHNARLLVKLSFPREGLLLAGMLVVGFNTLLRLAVIVVALHFMGVHADVTQLLSLLGLGATVLLGTCLGLLLTPLGVLYNDVSKALAPLLSLWMLITPVVFPARAALGRLYVLNPVAPAVEVTRALLIGRAPPMLGAFGVVVAATLVGLALTWLLFRVAVPHVVARLGQ